MPNRATRRQIERGEIDAAAITYRLPDASRVAGLSVRTLYNLNKRGELDFVKVGSRTLVRRSDLEKLLGGEPG